MKAIFTNGERRRGTSKKTGNPYDFSSCGCIYKEGGKIISKEITLEPSVFDADACNRDGNFPLVVDVSFGFGGKVTSVMCIGLTKEEVETTFLEFVG